MPPLNALHHLVDYALAQGLVISVTDGVKKSSDRAAIIADATAQDEVHLNLYKESISPLIPEGEKAWHRVGIALIVGDTGPDEHVADHSANEWFDVWWKTFDAENTKALEKDVEIHGIGRNV